MTSKTRGGFLIPALYGVNYNPPAQSAAAQIDLSTLAGFNGIVSNAGAGVYNCFSGPLDLHITLIAIIVTGIPRNTGEVERKNE